MPLALLLVILEVIVIQRLALLAIQAFTALVVVHLKLRVCFPPSAQFQAFTRNLSCGTFQLMREVYLTLHSKMMFRDATRRFPTP